jgi:hypothetical protein
MKHYNNHSVKCFRLCHNYGCHHQIAAPDIADGRSDMGRRHEGDPRFRPESGESQIKVQMCRSLEMFRRLERKA